MNIYYDFHIHSALSPCGDNDMTPNNIVNMAYLKGLGAIAVTDHNSAGNLRAVKAAADSAGITLLPGIEVETAEEIHILCYFETVDAAEAFETELFCFNPRIPNRRDIFGDQFFMDENDNITGEAEYLLACTLTLPIKGLKSLTESFGGVCVPAHVDKQAYSIYSNLGSIPPEYGFTTLELSARSASAEFASKMNLKENYRLIQSSDAHYLENIMEKTNFINIYENSTKNILEYLKIFTDIL